MLNDNNDAPTIEESPVVQEEDKKKIKKHSRFFDIYISKVLKQVSKNEITANAKNQLNNLLIIISNLISDKVYYLLEYGKKKTISTLEIINAIKLLFIGELQNILISEGQKSVENYKKSEEDKKGLSRQNKAEILFPPSVCEKFLRKYEVLLTADSSIFLAGTLEYICAELLDLSSSIANLNNRIRITVRDLEIAVRTDIEFNQFFKSNNIEFIGGGIIPYINPAILNNKSTKNRLIEDMKDIQTEGDCLMLTKNSFEKVVRKILAETDPNLKISKLFLSHLQYYIEQNIINLLQKSNNLAIYAGRIKMIPSDIEMVISIEENRLPNFLIREDSESSSGFTSDSDSI
jgi:histone H3/H4